VEEAFHEDLFLAFSHHLMAIQHTLQVRYGLGHAGIELCAIGSPCISAACIQLFVMVSSHKEAATHTTTVSVPLRPSFISFFLSFTLSA
jgi:uncharacterized membrane protein YhfC